MSWDLLYDIFFDILTYGVFLYSVLLLLSYLLIGFFSIGEVQKYLHKNSFTDYRILATSVHAPTVSILAPAYNEGKTIVENVKSLLSIYYTNLEVIIINDGSKDDCLQQMIDAYDLEKIDYFVDYKIPAKEVRGIYKSRNPIHHKLLVVDKVNGGKADALNVGINVSSNDYLMCIDVDCILEQDALLKMIKPFLEQTDEIVIASGGVVRIANSCEIEEGRLVKVRLAEDYLPRMQILEYIRAFILGRMAWSRLNGLMLISGAFGAFDKDIAIKAGGYDHNTVGEDMELVVRMRRYMEERNIKYRVTYIPDPLCWTEAPASLNILGRQRNRWIRGTIETLKFHKKMFMNPKYGLLGMLSYPYWFFFEMCAPVIEFIGFVCFIFLAFFGYLDWGFFFSYLLFIVFFGYLYSAFAVLMEVVTFNQYKRRTDNMKLLLTALTEPFYFHPFVVWSAIKGYKDYFLKRNSWGEMTRQGFAKKTIAPPTPIPATPAPIPEAEAIAGSTPVVAAPAPPSPAQIPGVIEFEKTKLSFLERMVYPLFTTIPIFFFHSFRYFLRHAVVLLVLFIVARGFEIGYDISAHGQPELLGKVILLGLAKDLAFFLNLGLWFYLAFTLCFLIHKKIAHVFFIIVAVVLLLIQFALSQYFVTTLVPLGADLWSYSIADIKQTVGASGGIGTGLLIGIFLLLALIIFAFIYLPKRIQIHGGIAFVLAVGYAYALATNFPEKTDRLLPGKEYSNALSLNKSDYFYRATYLHFFPESRDLDIYSDNYSGDFAGGGIDNNMARFNYIDEQAYPFLHSTDSTANVLAPFFDSTGTPPNIVILLVEGLGRAFSNKGAILGNFTPFIDSLSEKSLYWENFLSQGGRTFAVLPSLLGSLPFAKSGFAELGDQMPAHLSIMSLLNKNGYRSSFYYGGDSRFDNMNLYLQKNGVGEINDERTFPAGYTKMPANEGGFSWGYGDKELFRRYFETMQQPSQPYLNVVLTVSTHNPFLINESPRYLQRFEQRMRELGFPEATKQQYRNYKDQYASILYMNDAIKGFIEQYRQRPDFANTVFLITGDHRLPEIPMSSRLDRYHVPFLIYSPLLKRTAKFSSISSHFDIAPSLMSWLKESHQLQVPSLVSWMGSGLDTARAFRNIHAYPIIQTKTEMSDFVMGPYLLGNNELYRISNNMDLTPIGDVSKTNQLKAGFNRFKSKNNSFTKTPRLMPDSILQKYGIK